VSSPSGLNLTIEAIPSTICVDDTIGCNANVGESQVTMAAQAPNYTVAEWPPVQVAFVVETTPYDGVYDPTGGGGVQDSSVYGRDSCAKVRPGWSTLCEESNGVPFFVSHAQQIADAIVAANPNTNVSFAMVDYFATLDGVDDEDGQEYHVDIPRFVPAIGFGAQVASSFQAVQLRGGGMNPPSGYVYYDSDLSDNILTSSSITALYGTIIGSGINWSAATHHVIVWIGSTAPRDPEFPEEYGVSPSYNFASSYSTCEPSFHFGDSRSPACEGWVDPHDGSHTDSIADLARSASTCTDSIGKVCTVDTIDLYTTPTDPDSAGWPCTSALRAAGGCPGGKVVQADTENALNAGCDLAAATGGTWSGPAYFTCPNGTAGSLALETVGTDANHPNTDNPQLMTAFQHIGFGPELNPLVANGTARPMFQFVPYGSIHIVPGGGFQSRCTRANPRGNWNCDPNPTVWTAAGATVYGWNWSDNPVKNQMYLGDAWSVSFLVYASGPPYGPVPVDTCMTVRCHTLEEVTAESQFTSATYRATANHTVISKSFPLELITVLPNTVLSPPPTGTPGTPPNLPPVGIPVTGALPTAVAAPAAIGSGAVPLQALFVGLTAAGFIRLSVRTRSVAMGMAIRLGRRRPTISVFDREAMRHEAPLGRFE
jgi:hypothetical protein